MIDLHTHTFLSDGDLVAAELIRRASCLGYRYLGITDHADSSNMEMVIEAAKKAAAALSRHWEIRVIPGVELTHIPPALIPELVREGRRMGARLVVVHGETIVEPVQEGTNRAAIRGGADILSHPGMISAADAGMAARKGVHLEITTRKGHSLANGHVARIGLETGAPLILGTDSHGPADLTPRDRAEKIARGAGLRQGEVRKMFANAERLARKLSETA
ncbi:histidinol phosphate phosphatase domain-containing protein [bacterium]|nr:histidinol phosphate phosphatase domain-containing protein [bacterium]